MQCIFFMLFLLGMLFRQLQQVARCHCKLTRWWCGCWMLVLHYSPVNLTPSSGGKHYHCLISRRVGTETQKHQNTSSPRSAVNILQISPCRDTDALILANNCPSTKTEYQIPCLPLCLGNPSQETRANKFPKGSRASKGEQHWKVPETPVVCLQNNLQNSAKWAHQM